MLVDSRSIFTEDDKGLSGASWTAPPGLHLESAAVELEVRVLNSLSGEQLLQDIRLHVEGRIPVIRRLLRIDRLQETVRLFRGAELVNSDSTVIGANGGIDVLNAVFALDSLESVLHARLAAIAIEAATWLGVCCGAHHISGHETHCNTVGCGAPRGGGVYQRIAGTDAVAMNLDMIAEAVRT